MLAQNSPDFLDRFGMGLRGVAGAHDLFRYDSFDVGAFVSDDSVGFSGERSVAEHGDDRVGGDARISGKIV